jgi:hypothetical protein
MIIQDKINAKACDLSKRGHRLYAAYSQHTTRTPFIRDKSDETREPHIIY